MSNRSIDSCPSPDAEDELYDLDGVPEDGVEAWLGLLRIALTFSASTAALFAVCWAIV